MATIGEITLRILQGLWGVWPLLFIYGLEGAEGWRSRQLDENLALIKSIVRGLLMGWLAFVVLWIVLAIVKRPPTSFIIPETLSYSFFWLFGIFLIGVEAFLIFADRTRLFDFTSGETTSLDDLLGLTSEQFIQLAGEVYRVFGYGVQRAIFEEENGVDLILQSARGGQRVVLCKQQQGNLGEKVVRDFYYAMQRQGAGEGAVITTGSFTVQAREWAKDKPIRLYNGREFLKVWRRAEAIEKQRAPAG